MVDLGAVWTAGGVVVGLQLAVFLVRLNREIDVGRGGDVTWLPLADVVNLVSMLITSVGVFIVPALSAGGVRFASRALGLALILLVGYPFAVAGHYEMFNPQSSRSMAYCPRQEAAVLVVLGGAAIAYLVIAIVR